MRGLGNTTTALRDLAALLARGHAQHKEGANAIRSLIHTPSRSFHTSHQYAIPRNRSRGASALRRQPYPGRVSLQYLGDDLPQPVTDPSKHTEVVTSPNHGLWGFFNKERVSIPTPEEDHRHGRAWAVEELRHKSWDDLHKLWWACVKERNILATQQLERERVKPGYGESEAYTRNRLVRDTQRAIKHALTERYYAWQEALKVAELDSDIDLSGKGPAYNPQTLDVDPSTGAEALSSTDEAVPELESGAKGDRRLEL
ncbi:54S ribosomal protein L4 mitochondrial [Orbilia blumenaviensis]|uniref:Large ribosomal subunit protein uL29m n=1 Tax=Orbilia blumenaviensis TaxID=1796055 RepID=A0AAV9UKT2_9PEZI